MRSSFRIGEVGFTIVAPDEAPRLGGNPAWQILVASTDNHQLAREVLKFYNNTLGTIMANSVLDRLNFAIGGSWVDAHHEEVETKITEAVDAYNEAQAEKRSQAR